MGRFAFIGDEYLNTDHILSITIQESDNTMYIELDNGRTITRPAEYQLDIFGDLDIVRVIPVRECFAEIRSGNSAVSKIPVHLLAVTANGELRPLDTRSSPFDFMDYNPGFYGLIWPESSN